MGRRSEILVIFIPFGLQEIFFMNQTVIVIHIKFYNTDNLTELNYLGSKFEGSSFNISRVRNKVSFPILYIYSLRCVSLSVNTV